MLCTTCPVSRQKSRDEFSILQQQIFDFLFICLFYSLKEFLPQSYVRANKIEKKVFQEHKALQNTSEIEAKVKYVKLARGLPTFGVHFFLVKVSNYTH